MAKNITTSLLTDIQKGVTTMATLIEFRRRDTKTIRLTNHDRDITFEGNVYRHDIPFSLASIATNSDLSVDNTELSLFCDGTLLNKTHFRIGLYNYAEVTIRQVDFTSPSDGSVIMRKGWFGEIVTNEHDVVKITIAGLLKLLDFTVGHTYQPSCDADLGDRRCKVAANPSQFFSKLNPYSVGDWVYRYDTSLMTSLTVVNPGFETDGARTTGQAITGWSKSSQGAFTVDTGDSGLNAYSGTYALYGANDGSGSASFAEQYLYQDISVSSLSSAIDAGKIAVYFTAVLGQLSNTLDPVRLRLDCLDSGGVAFYQYDTGFQKLDTHTAWRERALVGELRPGTRTVRIYLWFKKLDGTTFSVACDSVDLRYWDTTSVTPHSDVIHQLTRIVDYGDIAIAQTANRMLTLPSLLSSTSVTSAIDGWTGQTGSYWRIVDTGTGLTGAGYTRWLMSGDDGLSAQRTDTIFQSNQSLSNYVDSTRVALGNYIAEFSLAIGYTDVGGGQAKVYVEQYDVNNVLLETNVVQDWTAGAATGWVDVEKKIRLNASWSYFKWYIQAKTPTGSGNGTVAFTNVKWIIYDVTKAAEADEVIVIPGEDGVWGTTAGAFSYAGDGVFRAQAVVRKYDTVASVTSKRHFAATTMAGVTGTYETGVIEWLSGQNAGLKNLIRVWNPTGKLVTLYFQSAYPISIGDRFAYTRSCQKRFLEDCQLTFKNQLNFRGFPHLPGRLQKE